MSSEYLTDVEETSAKKVERTEHQTGLVSDDRHTDQSSAPQNPALLNDSRLNGRGNGPVRVALMQGMQQTHGNRAMQRLLQRSKEAATTSDASASDDLANRIQAKSGGGSALQADTQRSLEAGLEADLSGVRVHSDSESDHLARSVDATAFTTGNDIFFREGAYNPASSEGMHLLAHEATHTVQQSKGPVSGTPTAEGVSISDPSDSYEQAAEQTAKSVVSGGKTAAQRSIDPSSSSAMSVQRFGSQEHQSLGNSATNGLSVNVGGDKGDEKFDLYYGDVVALSGDYFPPDLLMDLAKVPGDKGTKAGTRDEIVYVLHLINAKDKRFDADGSWAEYPAHFSDDVKNAVTERYQKMAASNNAHFAAPRGRDAAGNPNPVPAGEGSAGGSYRDLHEAAIRMAYQIGKDKGDISHALATEAAAQHFLTDAFSAGHLRTEVGNLREYWHDKYPLFWYNLRHKIALDTAVQMNDQDTNVTTILGSVQQMYEAISGQVEAMAGSLPAVTLGDLLSKVFHDYDNEKGIAVEGGGRVFGDDHLDDPSPDNMTRKLAEGAIRAGIVDIEKACDIGKAGTELTDEKLYAAVQAGTIAAPGKYVAESMMPKPDPSTPGQNWKADTFEALWDMPIVGTSGTKVGERVVMALNPGNEIRTTLDDLGNKFPEVEKRGSGNLHPRKAYLESFVAPMVADPKRAILNTINWAPSYGLSGEDKDDVSLATGQELDKNGELGGMTTPARVDYVKELIGGNVGGDEESLVMRLFETASAAERPAIYERVEGHKWTGDWIEGVFTSDDDLWNALNSTRLSTLKDLINEGWSGGGK